MAEIKELRAELTHWFQYPRALPPFFTESHKRRVLFELLPGYTKPDEIEDSWMVAEAGELYQPLPSLFWDGLPYTQGYRPRRLFVEEAIQLQGYKYAA
jgi:hypothetical protein